MPGERLIWPDPGNTAIPITKVEDTSGTVWLGDAGGGAQAINYWGYNPGNGFYPLRKDTDGTPIWGRSGNRSVFVGRHFDGANWCYVDRHVKWRTLQSAYDNYQMFTPKLD